MIDCIILETTYFPCRLKKKIHLSQLSNLQYWKNCKTNSWRQRKWSSLQNLSVVSIF